MGADQPIRKDVNAMGIEFEQCHSNREDYQVGLYNNSEL